MKIEITNKFIKDLEKVLKKEVAIDNYCEIQEISVSLFDGVWYNATIAWGNSALNCHYTIKLFFTDNDSIDFIRGQFSRVVYEVEVLGKVIEEDYE